MMCVICYLLRTGKTLKTANCFVLFCSVCYLFLVTVLPSISNEEKELFARTPTIVDHPSLERLNWLSGTWVGSLSDKEKIEESWLPDLKNCVVGIRRAPYIQMINLKRHGAYTKFFDDELRQRGKLPDYGRAEIFYNRDAFTLEFHRGSKLYCKASYELQAKNELKVTWEFPGKDLPNQTYLLNKAL